MADTEVKDLVQQDSAADADFLILDTDQGGGVFDTRKISVTDLGKRYGVVYKISLTSAQILALNTTPIQLIAPVAGEVILPQTIVFRSLFNSAAYTTNLDLEVFIDSASVNLFEKVGALNYSSNVSFRLDTVSNVNANEFIQNRGLKIRAATADPLAGDSDAEIYVFALVFKF